MQANGNNKARQLQLVLSPDRLTRLMILGVAALGLASLCTQAASSPLAGRLLQRESELVRFFYLDHEHNLPTWFQVGLLLLCGGLLALIAQGKWRIVDRYAKAWALYAVIFFGLSLDELMSFHERLIVPFRETLKTGSVLYFAWVIPGAVFTLIVAALSLRFLRNLPRSTRHRFLFAGTVYTSGAIGVEMISGAVADAHGMGSAAYVLLAHAEELLEMIGGVVFLRALLGYAGASTGAIMLQPLARDRADHQGFWAPVRQLPISAGGSGGGNLLYTIHHEPENNERWLRDDGSRP